MSLLAQGRAREGARQDADEGDADLDRGEEAARILHEGRGPTLAPGAAWLGHGLQARAAGGDDGKFRESEDAVQGDESDDDDQFEQRCQEQPTGSGRVLPFCG